MLRVNLFISIGGDLDGLIRELDGSSLPEEQVLRYFSQICLGLKAIHDQ